MSVLRDRRSRARDGARAATAAQRSALGRVRLRGRGAAQVIGCLAGLGLLQFAVRVLAPPLEAGPAFITAMVGNLLLAAAVAATICTVLRRVLPVVLRDASAALTTIAVLYLAVVASFLGLNVVGAAALWQDGLVTVVLVGVLALTGASVRSARA
ncbi:hypothetical protein [uncultured Amnibacterium sp.]|uniref:hypothetical protein n=1 Tax=uncultured Amnibacterium sp. TaxID=1631851 RepID=UPI0035CB6148